MNTKSMKLSRRDALKSISLLGTGMLVAPVIQARSMKSSGKKSPQDKPGILAIGVNSRGMAVAMHACNFGTMVACCDADTATFGPFQARLKRYQSEAPVYYTDYKAALQRDDVDVVTIGTQDHWHALMTIDAIKAGKDVYLEKPMTLTIGEGKAVCEAVRNSDRVLQIGTQQRSEYDGIFLKAIAIAREGILGGNLKATAFLPKKRTEKDIYTVTNPPNSLNWDKWIGPVQELPYCPPRCHKNWRGFVETGYGALTDWGAHHVDIAHWALGVENTGPIEITGQGTFPLGKDNTLALINGKVSSSAFPNMYSIVRDFEGTLTFENGHVIQVTDKPLPASFAHHENGLLLEGDKGSIFMSRQTDGFNFEGSLGEQIKNDKDLQKQINEKVIALYKGKVPAYVQEERTGEAVARPHMKNFFSCVEDRSEPISDVFTTHRANSSAILAHSAMLLDRKLSWEPDKQEFTADDEANGLLFRPYRAPHELG